MAKLLVVWIVVVFVVVSLEPTVGVSGAFVLVDDELLEYGEQPGHVAAGCKHPPWASRTRLIVTREHGENL